MTILFSQTGVGTPAALNIHQLRAWNFNATSNGVTNQLVINSSVAGVVFRAEIWSDNGNSNGGERPVTLLATSSDTTTTVGNVTVTFPEPIVLYVTSRYWISFVANSNVSWLVGTDTTSYRCTGASLANFADPTPTEWSNVTTSSVASYPYLVLSSTQPALLSNTPLVSGTDFVVTTDDVTFVPTTAVVSDGQVTKTINLTSTGNVNRYSGTMPMPVDGSTMLKPGNVQIHVSDGSIDTITRTTPYELHSPQLDNLAPTKFTPVTFTTLDVNNIGTQFSFNPALATGDVCAYDPERFEMSDTGLLVGNYTGDSIFYFRSASDQICRMWTVQTSTTSVIDDAPNAFTFTSITGSAISDTVESTTVTISGMTPGVDIDISIDNGQYSLFDGSTWSTPTNTDGVMRNGQQIKLLLATSSSYSTATTATVYIGSGSGTFTATTAAELDETPNTLIFTTISNVNTDTTITSAPISVTGLTPGVDVAVSIVNGTYSIFDGNTWSSHTASNGVIRNGYQIELATTSSTENSTNVVATVTIGSGSGTFTVSTKAAIDLVPNNFSFTPELSGAISTAFESNAVTISGMTPGEDSVISIINGTYSIHNGTSWSSYTSTTGVIRNGYQVRVKLTSAATEGTLTTTTLTIGGVNGSYNVTTVTPDDLTPNAFTFSSIVDTLLNTVIESLPVTIGGMTPGADSPITVSGTGAMYSIHNGTSWASYTSAPGVIRNGYQVKVLTTSSLASDTDTVVTLTIGGVSGTFTTTTLLVDYIPNAFTFATITDANLSVTVESQPITITGITPGYDSSITISGSSALYSIYNGSTWSAYTNQSGNIRSGYSLKVIVTSSDSPETDTIATVTIGGIVGTFTVSTQLADTTPDAFSFTQLVDVARNQQMVSNTINVSGLTAGFSTNLTVTNLNYSRYVSGAWSTPTNTATTVVNGDIIRAHITSSVQYGASTSGQMVIGGVSATFLTTTLFLDTIPNPISFPSVVNAQLDDPVDSQPITITGVTPNEDIDISIIGGAYSIHDGTSWSDFTSSDGVIRLSQQLRVQVYAADTEGVATTTTVNVGGVFGTFTVTTAYAADLIPNDFTIPTMFLVDPSSSVESIPVGITGITPGYDSPTSSSLLVYSIYRNGAWTPYSRGSISVNNGDYIKVSLFSSNLHNTSVSGAITIGGVTRTYTVKTIPKPLHKPDTKHQVL